MVNKTDNKTMKTTSIIVASVLIVIGLIALAMWGLPTYNLWRKEMSGKAQLAQQEWEKQIKIEEAKANLEAEKLNAQAEIERAKGAAESIAIEGGELTETYIRYLWVRQQNDLGDKTIIYVPTEAGLPVLEAGRANQ